MVEKIEKLGTKINMLAFINRERLQDSKICPADPRAAALRPLCSSQCAQQSGGIATKYRTGAAVSDPVRRGRWRRCIFSKAIRIEIIVRVVLRLQFLKRRQLCRFA